MRLWTGQTISVFGSVVGMTAMGFTAIYALNATPFQLGLLSAARLAPGFLTGLAAGAWVDRIRRRPILIGADIGRAILLATIPLAALLGRLRIGQLYAVTFLVSILTIFFDVAYESYLPSLTGRDRLIEGNGKLSATASAAEVGGFGLGGWLVHFFTAPFTILIDAVSFAVSAVCVSSIRAPELPPQRNTGQPDIRREIVEGLIALLRHRLLRPVTACVFSKGFFNGILGALIVLFMARDLGFGAGTLGSIWAVGGISSFCGAMAAEPLTRRIGIGPAMILGSFVSGAGLLLIPLAHGATLTAALLLILQQIWGDGAAAVYQITQVSLRQTVTPERLLGRINASAGFFGLGATLAGSLLGGLMGEIIGVRTTLFLAASGNILSTLWLVLSPVRALRIAPPSTEFFSHT